MLSLIYQYIFEKRPENIKKREEERKQKFNEIIDQLMQKDDDDVEFKTSVKYPVDSEINIDELGWNCTRHEGKKFDTSKI